MFEILWVLLEFSTLTYLNPGFGRPWDMLGIFFVNDNFITLQKKSLGQKKVEFYEVPFCRIEKLPKWQFWTCAWNSKKNLSERLLWRLWRWHLQKVFLKVFSKRTHKVSKILFNLCSCKFLARLESKIRKCLFFDGSLLYKYSVQRELVLFE